MNNLRIFYLSTLTACFLLLPANAQAATIDLASSPLVTVAPVTVSPNIFLMMDDSGSMDWDFMPDNSNNPYFNTNTYGYQSSQCNGVFYNPNITYTTPVDSTGAHYTNSSFIATWMDGFKQASRTINLSTNFNIRLSQSNTNPPSQGYPAYYYKYTGSQLTPTLKNYLSSISTFYLECNSAAPQTPGSSGGSTPGSSVFTYVKVSATSGPNGTDERTNFANWFSYYRTRINMMKTGTGLAFSPLTSKYQVGFATMNNNGGTQFVNPTPFDSSGKSAWYTKLYGSSASSSTPLLQALSKVGLMYANKLPENKLNTVTATDPIQYSCQQNFAILSSDGYWNDQTNQTLTAGPSTTAVGNQDGTETRPQYDGASSTTTKSTSQKLQTQQQILESTGQIQKQTTQKQMSTSQLQSRGSINSGNRWSTWNNVPICVAISSGIIQTMCRSILTGPSNVSSCSAGTTQGLTTTCTNLVVPYANASSCTAGKVAGLTTDCQTISLTSSTPAASCSAGTSSSGIVTTCQTISLSNLTPIANCSASSASSSNNYVTTTCSTVNTGPTTVPTCLPQTAALNNNWTTTTCGATVSSGGTKNTLADVADYYYKTDLRSTALGNCTGNLGTATDVCTDDVPTTTQDTASWQHMTTFTLGLGAPGRMIFSPSYTTDTSGDFYSVANGVSANPPDICSWQTNGKTCNWPTPKPSGDPENIDDLWHAAVDGRGLYFNATNPSELSTGLNNALKSMQSITGNSSAATTSNPNVTNGDNYVFSSTFTTNKWSGQLIRQQINIATGLVPNYNPDDPSTYDWAAQSLLKDMPYALRTIYTTDNSTSLKTFNETNFASSKFFTKPHIDTLSQFCTSSSTCLNNTSQTTASGANLINYLIGDRSHEGSVSATAPNAFYRTRATRLGDIADSETVYVNQPLFQYEDLGFNAHLTALSCRQPMVYVGANDGMLHAFYATSGPSNSSCSSSSVVAGSEAWAYIPSLALKNLYKLADQNYSNNHQFYVDGSPIVNDICISNCTASNAVWKTILVGGLNEGGRGYYALDITNPTSPNLLWEFTSDNDSNLGYTYGNPVITKLNDGTWVVLVSSGYNNVSPGDGKGHLYVLNAATGALITQISTGVGDTTTPSGLSRINAWVTNAAINNTALRVYGGDLLGNFWRFDLNALTTTYDAQLLVTFKDASNNPQPITAKPELGLVNSLAVAYIGTGKFLGVSDLSTTQQQSFYAVKDTLAITTAGTAIWNSPHAATCATSTATNCFVNQTITSTSCPSGSNLCAVGQTVFTATNNVVNLASQRGWFINLPNLGERANTDPSLTLGTLVFNTNTPSVSSCTQGGFSDQYILDYRTGGAINPTVNTIIAIKIGSALSSRAVLTLLPNNIVTAISNLSDGNHTLTNIPIMASTTSMRRISWHELISN